jgi:hypothetical protein
MVRQHPAADGDRPHFYSQYWLNVALGKPAAAEATLTATATATATAAPTVEPELELPTLPARPEPVRPAKKAPEKKQEPARLSSLADLANIEELMKSSQALPDDMVPDIEAEPAIVTDFDLSQEPVAEVQEDEGIEPFEDEEFDFDEEEEEDEWGGRRPGKGPKKPTRPQKPPRRRDF